MAARKSERLLNLLITLLVARTYVGKDRIRTVIEQYREQTREAFEKMFERDKEELRSLGVPIEVGYVDRAFADEPGYRISRSAFELPEIHLEPDEAGILGVAARVWQHAGLAAATSDALVKLKAAGVSVDRSALQVVEPRLPADEPTFEAFWAATQTRTSVAFRYRGSSSADATLRHLQPWRVVCYRGRWYVVGLDTDRGEPRMFRLSRVQGAVTPDHRAAPFSVPDDVDLSALTRSLAPPPAERSAILLVRRNTAHGLRRHAEQLAAPDAPKGWDRIEVAYGRTEALADEVLSYGADVVVERPEEVRSLVLRTLREVAGATTGLPDDASGSDAGGGGR